MAGVPLSFRAALVALFVAASPLALHAEGAEPLQIFARFKSALDANDLASASARAEELISAIETQYGGNARELVNPVTNLGTVQFRRGEFSAAEASYQRAIKLIEGQLSGADRLLIRPLQGLGETWLMMGRPADAAVVLKRAVDLSRNLDGLYNAEQLDAVDALIEAYASLGRDVDAEREHQFAFRIAETNYGKRDLRLVEPLDRLARWYEAVGRYSTARGLHARALQLAEELSTERPIVGVPALRGLARTWMLESVYGPEVSEEPGLEPSDSRDPFFNNAVQGRMNQEGLRALNMAVEIINRTPPVDMRLLGETMAQIGDWHLLAGNNSKAYASYAESWKSLEPAGSEARRFLEVPRPLVYRAPSISLSRMGPQSPDEYAIREVDMRLKVGRDGKVQDAVVAQSSAPENSSRAALTAARKARFAPRIENGQAVETEGVPLVERLLIRIQREKPQASTSDRPVATP